MSGSGPFLPGSTLGILGSGQLGRMLAMVAKRMGYRVCVFSPEADSPAGQVADAEIVASYDDTAALKRFAQGVDVVTIEFENIPVEALQAVETHAPVYPQPNVLYITQNRLREKRFLSNLGLPVPFAPVGSLQELDAAIRQIRFPAVLKTAGFGYDGKGQVRVETEAEARAALEALQGQPAILEQWMDLAMELSVIAARTETEFTAYRPVENRHKNHILDVTLAPALLPSEVGIQALEITRAIMDALDVRGVLCVEFFLTKDGCLWVNELAPRPHNSGHYTIEAAVCSQFEQQLRAVCGLPLGETRLLSSAAMVNLLGDDWVNGEPDWMSVLKLSQTYLHLYGKKDPRSGRKMGHLTALADTPREALDLARRAAAAMQPALKR